jgi:Gti1/Pac2 family
MTSNPDVPPFTGYVETTVNALRLIHAARQGVIPRITRRLNDSERRTMIKSGAVFVFSVEESGIKRWTGEIAFIAQRAPAYKVDGLLWSPSRIVGNFLVRSSTLSSLRNLLTMDVGITRCIARSTSERAVEVVTRNRILSIHHLVECPHTEPLQTKRQSHSKVQDTCCRPTVLVIKVHSS